MTCWVTPYDDIAEILGKNQAACRQLAVRARRQLQDERPQFEAYGAGRVARVLAGAFGKLRQVGIRVDLVHVGGQIADGVVAAINGVVNPDKLTHGPVAAGCPFDEIASSG